MSAACNLHLLKAPEEGRIYVLDVLRGFAILGILIANITSFATPAFATQFGPSVPNRNHAEWLFDAFTLAFVNGKFRSILAVLFGIGLWMQYERRSAAGTWPRSYLKRTGLLLLLGLLHGYLIWYGDILALYALVAAMTMIFVKAKDQTLWWLIVVLAANAFLTSIVLLPVMLKWFGGNEAREWDLGQAWSIFTAAGETAVFQAGTWFQQLGCRAIYYTIVLVENLVLGPLILPLFIFGVLLARREVLQNPSGHPLYRKWCLILGFGVGLPLSLLGFIPMSPRAAESVQVAFETFVGPLLSLGYTMALAVLVEKARFELLTGLLAKVGRVALSAYLLQSLACTFVFYSWGLGYFGKLQPMGWIAVIVAVWALNVVSAVAWLRFFKLGPVEWAWRSASEGRLLSLLRSPME
jgi:uncharacterized protein